MAITGPIEGVAADGTITHSKLTCPECGHTEELEMPTNACQFFHECSGCHVLRVLFLRHHPLPAGANRGKELLLRGLIFPQTTPHL